MYDTTQFRPKFCEACGEEGAYHYVSSVGHLSHPDDAIEPYYTCKPGVPANVARKQGLNV